LVWSRLTQGELKKSCIDTNRLKRIWLMVSNELNYFFK